MYLSDLGERTSFYRYWNATRFILLHQQTFVGSIFQLQLLTCHVCYVEHQVELTTPDKDTFVVTDISQTDLSINLGGFVILRLNEFSALQHLTVTNNRSSSLTKQIM